MMMSGWSQPRDSQLRSLIESKGMYPITLLNLHENNERKLSRAGILLVNELAVADEEQLYRKTKIQRRNLGRIINQAKSIIA